MTGGLMLVRCCCVSSRLELEDLSLLQVRVKQPAVRPRGPEVAAPRPTATVIIDVV